MAKNKKVSVLLSLKDQFTKPMRNATKNLKSAQRQFKKTQNAIKKFGGTVKNVFLKIGKYAAIGFGALTAGLGLSVRSFVDAAKEKIQQETNLQAVLVKTPGMTQKAIDSVKAYASALQEQGVVADEVTLAGAQQLGTYQLQAKNLKTLLPGLQDLLVQTKGVNGTTDDAINIANMFGKVMNGQVGALTRAGIIFNDTEARIFKYGTETQKAATLAKVLEKNVGGVNRAMAQTDQGKIAKVLNNLGGMKQEIGRKILPYIAKVAEWFDKKIPAIQDLILSGFDKFEEMLEKAKPYLLDLKEVLASVFENLKPILLKLKDTFLTVLKVAIKAAKWIRDNWDRISPIIYTIVGAFAALKAIYLVQAGVTAVLTAKQVLLNTAMTANPIGLVVAAIATLIGVCWTLYRNWDLVKKKAGELWDWIKNLWDSLDNNPFTKAAKQALIFLNPFKPLIDAFKFLKTLIWDNWDVIKSKFIPIIEALKNPVDTAKKALNGLLDKFKFWNNTKLEDKTLSVKEEVTTDKKENVTRNDVTKDNSKPQYSNYYTRHALGSSYFKGGVTGINEGGREETAILPAGTKILSHEQSKTIENNSNKTVNVTVNVQGNVIGEEEQMKKFAEYTGQQILYALNNS